VPVEKEFRQALEITELTTSPLNKGEMTRVFVGSRGDFRMRSVLNFLIDLPQDAEIVSGFLHLYVLGFSGELPIELRVHLLERDFEEKEVTYLLAAEGEPWNTPGGDFLSEPLGSASFDGNRVDTVIVELDEDILNDHLPAINKSFLPLIVVSDNSDSYVGLVAGEYAPDQPIDSRLDIIYKLSGGTTQSGLERRAYMDATIAQYMGPGAEEEYLTVGELPASQIFFAYELSQLPRLATVNQAKLHLSIAGMAIVDSFYVSLHTTHELSFVPPEELFLGAATSVGSADTAIVIDATLALQRLILEQPAHTGLSYIVVSSFSSVNVAGFLKIYPPNEENIQHRPYLKLIYTDTGEGAAP